MKLLTILLLLTSPAFAESITITGFGMSDSFNIFATSANVRQAYYQDAIEIAQNDALKSIQNICKSNTGRVDDDISYKQISCPIEYIDNSWTVYYHCQVEATASCNQK